MSRLRPKDVVKELKKRLEADNKDLRPLQIEDYCFDKQIAFINDPARFKTAVCSRRCLAKGTLVQTTLGPKPIEAITIEDWVFDEHGLPIKVKAVYDNGPQQVVELLHNSKVLAKTTTNHVFLTYHPRAGGLKQRHVEDIYDGVKIVRNEVDRNNGAMIKHAYAIGALLGDGCSLEGGKSYISISSENAAIPNKVGELLGATLVKKAHPNNYTYRIYAHNFPEEYYAWCHKRYAHEKTTDLQRILSWDRQSRLAFVAGLLDTDGSVCNAKDGLQIDISMQAEPVIRALQILFLDLWQVAPSILTDNRPKYKNGPVYVLRIKHNYFGKKILKDLTPYLQTERKKFKPEYEQKLENNYNAKYVGVRLGKTTVEHTYDIHVDSPTNLYMLANGLITHNSGKTVACAVDLLTTAQSKVGDVAYITLNRRSAKRIIWKDLLKLNKDYNLGAKVDKQELSLTMPNGSVIYVSGAKDEAEIERFRGMALRKVYIDEAQSFRGYIQELIEDVIEPALTDYYGTLALIGTPGPLPSGFFYDISHSKGWAHHHWTMQENPHILLKSGKEPLEIIKELAERRGLTLNSPSILREYFGQWVRDIDSLVYTFDPAKNIYVDLPKDLVYVFGIDLGFNDADAIAVLGYSAEQRCVYLVEEYVRGGNDITQLVNKIKELRTKYDPVKMVMDAGALGKKIQEEIRLRHGVHTEAAEKARKLEYIALFNDDLRTSKFKAHIGSKFEEDSYLVEWDFTVPERPIVSSNYHTDIGDAVLYAWRECRHFYERDVAPPPPTPDEYMEQYWNAESEALARAQQGGDGFTDVSNWEDLGLGGDYDDDF